MGRDGTITQEIDHFGSDALHQAQPILDTFLANADCFGDPLKGNAFL
jgi:hypothetical protein